MKRDSLVLAIWVLISRRNLSLSSIKGKNRATKFFGIYADMIRVAH
jgi:hypothetical protein